MTTAVVVAIYNGEKYLKEQLLSILNQTRGADEVILCDDHSSDNSVLLIEEFILQHRLAGIWKLYRSKENLGYVRNFYRGIALTTADIVFLSDQDDIWVVDKIERMAALMERHSNILLLSCRYDIIGKAGEALSGLMVEKVKETGALRAVSVDDIMKALRWPGMTMALRKTFFDATIEFYHDLLAIHDVVMALFAAENGGFYEYQYIGCHHRRHDHNAANEEHRVFKLLSLERKLAEMESYNRMLFNLTAADLPLPRAKERIKEKYDFSIQRQRMIRQRQLLPLLMVYWDYRNMRWKSLFADVWLIIFGDYRKMRGNKNEHKV